MSELEFVCELALEGGAIVSRGRDNFVRLGDKADREVVTDLDKEVNSYILTRIQEAFPGDSILSEEDEFVDGGGDRVWVVDPIDGTINFIRGISFYCVSIALWENGKALIGVVYNPVSGELFYAERGDGAFLDVVDVGEREMFFRGGGLCGSNSVRLRVSDLSLSEGLMLHGQSYNQDDAKIGWRLIAPLREASLVDRQFGSAALMLCYVACGRAEIMVIPGTKAWDDAAGVLIVVEAGGKVVGFDGDDWKLETGSIIAGNVDVVGDAVEALGV